MNDSSPAKRAQFIIKDMLMNHLPRIKEGLEKGYVDENQIGVLYDHAMRARILMEMEEKSAGKENEVFVYQNIITKEVKMLHISPDDFYHPGKWEEFRFETFTVYQHKRSGEQIPSRCIGIHWNLTSWKLIS